MDTPICDFVKEYASQDPVRFHMPGHKGRGDEACKYDITEIDGADYLGEPEGIIKKSEENAGRLFDAVTIYSTEGSSLCIRAMLFLVMKKAMMEGKKAQVLAARNVHASFLSAAAILDIEVDFLMQREEESYESCTVLPEDISEYLKGLDDDQKPTALYVTSPDYPGNLLDIDGLSKTCHSNGMLRIVDNAHGAYLKFLKEPLHPISRGADMCCDSAHKTLPVLTGGAYLHISHNTDPILKNFAKQAMSVFATTSPSYLILQSLDRCNLFLENNTVIQETADKVSVLKDHLKGLGFSLKGEEPLKITVDRLNGDELAAFLSERDIFLEYHDRDMAVMMFAADNTDEDFERLKKALSEYSHNIKIYDRVEETGAKSLSCKKRVLPKRAMSFREAMFADSEQVDTKESVGRTLAEMLVHCPPCVPPYMLGEEIGEDITRYHSGMIRVVKAIK